jgi:hypothetical protein
VLDCTAWVLAFSAAFNSCGAAVYVPQRALNSRPREGFAVVLPIVFAALTMGDHCSLSPTEVGVYPTTSSMSQNILTFKRPDIKKHVKAAGPI